MARAIGKPLWEARTEVDAVIAKVDITLTAGADLVAPRDLPDVGARIRYRPVGVCAVIGPFNFPAHLPNGHLVPALAAGNVVVFKPSERAPEVGQIMAECFVEAGFPRGVIQMVQGTGEVAQALVGHPDVDAVMFTGSTAVGSAILAQSAPWPGRMLALELGGKNAAVVLDDADLAYAAREIAFAAYVTAGQRCTATSRVIVQRRVAADLLARLEVAARETRVGPPDATDVFLGPVISAGAQHRCLTAVADVANRYDVVVPTRTLDASAVGARGYYLAPGLYRLRDDVRDVGGLESAELFAPVLTIELVDSEDEAIERVNATRYGLAASVYTAARERFERLGPELAVGVCNWNRGTVGSSSRLPFGGVKDSGNHRAAGLFSAYYCVDPVAELLVPNPSAAGALPPGLRVG
jgi:succinylglutamic semialdehyde dehydrogenase